MLKYITAQITKPLSHKEAKESCAWSLKLILVVPFGPPTMVAMVVDLKKPGMILLLLMFTLDFGKNLYKYALIMW